MHAAYEEDDITLDDLRSYEQTVGKTATWVDLPQLTGIAIGVFQWGLPLGFETRAVLVQMEVDLKKNEIIEPD